MSNLNLKEISIFKESANSNKRVIIYMGGDIDLLESWEMERFKSAGSDKKILVIHVETKDQLLMELKRNWNVSLIVMDSENEDEGLVFIKNSILLLVPDITQIVLRYDNKSGIKIHKQSQILKIGREKTLTPSSFVSIFEMGVSRALGNEKVLEKDLNLQRINFFLRQSLQDSSFDYTIENILNEMEEYSDSRFWVEITNEINHFHELKKSNDNVALDYISPEEYKSQVNCEILKLSGLNNAWNVKLWNRKSGLERNEDDIFFFSLKDILTSSLMAYLKGKELKDELLKDTLTGLPNRDGLIKKIESAMESYPDKKFIFFLLSLTGFNEINSVLGHAAGDYLLKEVGSRMLNFAGSNPCGRITSDAFGWIMEEDEYRPSDLESIFETPIETKIIPYRLRPRVGAAPIVNQNEIANALKKAATAIKAAKKTKLNLSSKAIWFDEKMEEEANRRVYISQHLFEALKTESGLDLYFQPQFNLKKDRCIAAEALIRWKDKNGNFIGPDEFIPLAEQAGFAGDLSTFALKKTCELIQEMELQELDVSHISVNVSGFDFDEDNFEDKVISILNFYKVSPQKIRLEVTETAATMNPEKMKRVIKNLKERGLTFAIDDFGSGYSSLTQLVDLDVQELKIDKSLVQSMGTETERHGICKMAVDLGQSMNLEVVAEGIETELQKEILKAIGVQVGQGWLFSKALSKKDFINFLKLHQ